MLHVIAGLGVGGCETMLWRLLSASRGYWESMVVSLGQEGALAARIRELGVPVRCLRMCRGLGNPLRLAPLLLLVRRFHPQVVQGWMVHGNLAAVLAGLVSRGSVPVIWSVHQSLYDLHHERAGTAVAIRASALLSWFPKRIIYASQTSASHHERFGYRNSLRVVVPNGFDCDVFRPNDEARRQVLAELGIPRGAVVVGLVARYDPMKDHAGFLRAARIVAQRSSSAHFLLAGRGVTSAQAHIAKLVSELGLQGRISLLGERSDIARVTAALDVACSASWSEAFPCSIGEAMACGVPCVVTDVGDSSYLVGDTGIAVPARHHEALARGICEAIQWGAVGRRERGEAARRRIEILFSLPEVARRYQDIYQKCLQSMS